jgi:hypothetical protein
MNKTGTNYRQNRIIFLLMIVFALACYSLLRFLDWDFNRNSASLIALKQDNLSEIKIFDSASPQESLLANLNSAKDAEIIYGFVHAINRAEPSEPPARELILSHGLYLIISLKDSNKPIELLFHLHEDCSKTVDIDIVKKPGGVESYMTSYIGGVRSKVDLHEWLQSLNLLNYVDCN